ncbi:MAG TPA: hypothetical protein VHJ17_14355 [Thermomonospora sp.]|nr:hypothetical protein [Thermomonospora sp.]
MTTRRVLAIILGAAGPVAVMALLFGNQWFDRWVADSDWGTDLDVLFYLLAWLRFPAWRIADGSPAAVQLAADAGLLVFLAVLTLLVLAGCRALHPDRGFGAFVLGWWSVTLAAGLAGLLRGLLYNTTSYPPVHEFGPVVAVNVMNGAMFGLVYGWLPGLAVLLAFHASRPREGAAPVPPGHPATRPYVVQGHQPPPPPPPGAQPWAPPPPSPGAVPTGGFPFPPTPPAGYAPPVLHQPHPTGIAAAQPLDVPPAEAPEPAADEEPAEESTADDPGEEAVPTGSPEADPSPAKTDD